MRVEQTSEITSILAQSIEENLAFQSNGRFKPSRVHIRALLSNQSAKECMFCNHSGKKEPGREHSASWVEPSASSEDPSTYASGLSLISHLLRKKYLTSKEYYYRNVVQQIIYNEPTHMVCVFKDYLIYDDVTEFLKSYYETETAHAKLPKILHFYSKYSKVFPNYIVLPESKIMFKNIEDIQEYYDSRNRYIVRIQEEEQERKKNKIKNKQRLLDKLKQRARDAELQVCSLIENVEPIELEGAKKANKDTPLFNPKFIESIAKAAELPPIDFSLRHVVSMQSSYSQLQKSLSES